MWGIHSVNFRSSVCNIFILWSNHLGLETKFVIHYLPISSSEDSSAPTPALGSLFGNTGVTSDRLVMAEDELASPTASSGSLERLGLLTPQLKLSTLSPCNNRNLTCSLTILVTYKILSNFRLKNIRYDRISH